MKKRVFKLYWNVHEEEKWLNEMAQKGWGLCQYKWGRYYFEKIKPGKYEYKINLMDTVTASRERDDYLTFLSDVDIVCVATYMRWAYLRKEKMKGPIELYPDRPSKIAYCKRLHGFWGPLTMAELMIGATNLLLVLGHMADHMQWQSAVSLLSAMSAIVIGILFLHIDYPIYEEMKRLERESEAMK